MRGTTPFGKRASSGRGEDGQSLVELALALPVLLLILLALADFGRAFYYTTALTNAAREGAAFLSLNPTKTATDVKQQVCNESGLFAYNDVAGCTIVVTISPAPYAAGQDATVTAQYQFHLVSSYLVGRVFTSDPVQLTAAATYPGLK